VFTDRFVAMVFAGFTVRDLNKYSTIQFMSTTILRSQQCFIHCYMRNRMHSPNIKMAQYVNGKRLGSSDIESVMDKGHCDGVSPSLFYAPPSRRPTWGRSTCQELGKMSR
jgi:hypothetical protein